MGKVLGFVLPNVFFFTALLIWQMRLIPDASQVRASFHSTDRVVLDRSGRLVDEVSEGIHGHRLNWITLEQVAPKVRAALVREGGHPELVTHWIGARPLPLPAQTKFFAEWLRSFALTLRWTPRDILETEMNLAIYAGEFQGFSAASFALFDQLPRKLSLADSAVLLAMRNEPGWNLSRIHEKACAWLAKMSEDELCPLLDETHLGQIEAAVRIRPYLRMAPQFTERLIESTQGRGEPLIRSTLDRDLQWKALRIVQKAEAFEAAAVVIENSTGNILVYIGGVNGARLASDGDEASRARSAGSLVKPFLYARALDERILTPLTEMTDSPLAWQDSSPDLHHGVTLRGALELDLKIPAVRTLELLGVDSFVDSLNGLGLATKNPGVEGLSLALGTSHGNLLQLTNAYRALANGGIWSPARFSPDQLTKEARRRVFSPEAAFVISDLIKDNSLRFWSARASSTSQDEDTSTIGFSSSYTVGVWADSKRKANEVWSQMMAALAADEPSRAPATPLGLRSMKGEWLIAGTERHSRANKSRISFPIDHAMIAMDTDFPKADERFFIQVVFPREDQNLYLNGQRLGRAQPYLPWEPRTGRYTLDLRDSSGALLDRVHFKVQGHSVGSVEKHQKRRAI